MTLAKPAVALLVSAACALCAAPASAQITRGPYLQHTRLQQIDIVWEGTIAAPTVGWGLTSPDQTFSPATCSGAHCAVALSGLEPDTLYTYAVYSGGTQVSADGTFRTAPPVPRPFSFAVYGDNRSDDIAHSAVVDHMLAIGGFELALNTGDMVSSGEIEAQWDNFFAIEQDLLRHIPLYPAVGNHEEDDGKAEIVERLFHTPAAASSSPEPLYYSFDFGNSHFVAIDGEINVLPWYLCLLLAKPFDACLDSAQLAWLEADLNSAAADPWIQHVFVYMHKGPYSSKKGRTGSAVIRDLLPLFATSKVKLIISGHDHYYEHGISGNGVHYLISGGGGAPLYETEPDFLHALWPHEIHVSESVHNFQIIQVTGPLIEVTSYNADDGTVLDTFSVGEPPMCASAPDCVGEQEGVCVGEWTCVDFTCVWSCAPPPACDAVDDCPAAPVDGCPGAWECTLTSECHWVCEVIDECSADDDCAGKDPLNACLGGRYECVTGVCEWACDGPVPPVDADAGAVGQDAGATDVDAGATDADVGMTDVVEDTSDAGATDVGPSTDAGPTAEATTPPPDTATDAPPVRDGGAPAQDGGDGAEGGDSSGCLAAGAVPPAPALAMLVLFSLGMLRRSTARARDQAATPSAEFCMN